jgi:uncharacterized protein YmfQ (DUF2313 family)
MSEETVNPFESRHFRALSLLKPLPMDAEDYAVSRELDRLVEAADDANRESFASTCTLAGTLTRWEDAYGLPGTGTEEERKQALMAAVNRQWGIAAKHYRYIAEQMGFSVIIDKPHKLFRAGLSRVGEPVYDLDEQYIWTVHVDANRADCDTLVKELDNQRIPFTEIRWVFND